MGKVVDITVSGSFEKTIEFLTNCSKSKRNILDKYGALGVSALKNVTPRDSGKTSESWGYEIIESSSGYEICWTNSNINDGVNIALILQYGHGTRNGGYVQGVDYINPALAPVFDQLAKSLWEEVADASD